MLPLTAAVAVLFGYQLLGVLRAEGRADERVVAEATARTQALVARLDSLLSDVVDEGRDLAGGLGASSGTAEEVEARVKSAALSIPQLQGVTACYEPYALDSSRRLYCPYYDKSRGGVLRLGEEYDYTEPSAKTAWYTAPRDSGARWSEPYYGTTVRAWFVEYALPFFRDGRAAGGTASGTVTMSFDAGGLREVVRGFTLGTNGYGVVASPTGQLVAHPQAGLVGTANLSDLVEVTAEPSLSEALAAMRRHESGRAAYFDAARGGRAIFVYDQLSVADWSVGMLYYEDDIREGRRATNRRRIRLALLASLLAVLCLAMYYVKDRLSAREIWVLSALATGLLVADIVYVGRLYHYTPVPRSPAESAPVLDPASVATFTSSQTARATGLNLAQPVEVPTGVYIQRVAFANSYNVDVAGQLWQQYPARVAGDVEVGIRFPQIAPFAESAYLQETSRRSVDAPEGEEDYLLVVYDFRVTLRLNLGYVDFPFDKSRLTIELAPARARDGLLLVPKLDSYRTTTPSDRSGVDPSVRISGYRVLETYFDFALQDFGTDFGTNRIEMYEQVPTLRFNVDLERQLLTVFITYLIPIAVTMLLIFLLVYSIGKTAERQEIIGAMAAFFFVLVFSHIDLRREVVTAELMYIEYFYFITYAMVLLSTANLIAVTRSEHRVLAFNNNQLYKASFFPLFFIGVLLVTLVKFY